MYRKLLAVLVVSSLGCVSAFADDYHGEKGVLATNVTRAVAAESNMGFDATAFATYQEQVFAVRNPSYETLRPLFAGLTVYNADFANVQKKEIWGKLANRLATEVWTGWNTYRPVGMMEVFEQYFPQENKDAAIALLEYNVKNNLLSQEQKSLIAVFESMKDNAVVDFRTSYDAFVLNLQTANSYNPKNILEAFASVIESYNKLEKTFPEAVFLVKRSAFVKPIAAGWGRTVTVKDLRYGLGYEELAGGDYLSIYSPETLQEKYGVSAKTANLFFQFVKEYNK